MHAACRRDDRSSPSESGWGIVVVIAAHLNLALQIGLLRSVGVLYLSWKAEFDTSAKDTAAVQGIMTSLSCFVGLLGGVLTKRFGCRLSGIAGGFLTFLGVFCSYFVNSIIQLYITAAIIGTGVGIACNSVIVAVAIYFKRKYEVAHAVAFSGIGVGIIALPPLVRLLVDSYGWRGSLLIASAIIANNVALCALFRPKRALPKSKTRKDHPRQQTDLTGYVPAPNEDIMTEDDQNTSAGICKHDSDEIEAGNDPNAMRGSQRGNGAKQSENSQPAVILLVRLSTALGLDVFAKSYRFALLCALQVETSISYTGFLLYIIPRAQSTDVSPSSAAFLLSICGIGSLLGRLANGLLVCGKMSAENASAIAMALCGVSSLLLTLEGYAVFAIGSFSQGFGTGFYYTVMVVLIRRYVGLRKLAVSVGLTDIFLGTGSLIGPILSGWILDVTASYQTVFYVLAGLCFICALQMLLFPILKRVEPGIDIKPCDI